MLALALVGGVASGPSALRAGADSVPPIEWTTLPLVFLGSGIALFLVLAFELALKNERAFSYGWKLFAFGATTTLAIASCVASSSPQLSSQ